MNIALDKEVYKSANSKKLIVEWDLSDLYKSLDDTQIKIDLTEATELQKKFIKNYQGKIEQFNDVMLLKAIQEYEQICEITSKLVSFAYLCKAKNSIDQKINIFYQNIVDQVTKIEGEILFFSLEINKIDEEKINEFIAINKDLALYKSWFKKIFKFKKFNLSDEAEKVLYLKSNTSSSMLVRLYDELHTDAKYSFKDKLLSNNEIFYYLTSSIAEERKLAAESISKTLKANSKNLTMIFNMIAKDKSIEDELRGFKDSMDSRNLVNDIETPIVENLIQTVKGFYPSLSHRYFKLKAKWLNKEKLEYWDRGAPLPDSSNRIFSWNEAKEIVLKSYSNFCPKLADEARKFFDNNWIDATVTEGKASGAFCHPCVPSVHPYMLMNFQGKVYDIMTLSHELGHCVHYMLSKKNGYLANDIPLTFAETASVFGEQLTFQYLLSLEEDPKERKYLIAKKVEDMLNTVVRQIAFCDFEYQIHNKRKESELSNDEICDIWMKIQSESLGPAFNLNDEYRPYWSYISHFIHAPFYVYSYAFGDCLVNSLFKYFLANDHKFVDQYLNLLSAGGTMHHAELLKPFGMNLNDSKFWEQGLAFISELIDELEKIES